MSPSLGRRIDFLASLHRATKREYGLRSPEQRAQYMQIASQYGEEYWDGDRRYGFGGYHYDGRWRPIAEQMARFYGLTCGQRLLEIGCGKGYLLYEFTQAVPGIEVRGLDISSYAVEHAKEEVRDSLSTGSAAQLPFEDSAFDFIVSLATFDNLAIADLWSALREIERVGRGAKYVMVQSWTNEQQKAHFLSWSLAAKSFYSTEDWEWIFTKAGYTGDYGFVVYE